MGIEENITWERVLNPDFGIYVLFRCTKRKYAEDLLNGKIFFNTPNSWIGQEEKGNKGQGDILEGTFFTCKSIDNSDFIKHLKNNSKLEYFNHNNYTFFRKVGIRDYYCLCLYGLKSNQFSKIIDSKGIAHYVTEIGQDYFTSFSSSITKEEYEQMEVGERPVFVFINNPKLFFERVKTGLMKFGLKEKEIMISPVDYIDKYKVSLSILDTPRELFLKDNFFKNQSEVRIIVNSTDEKFVNRMRCKNNIVDVGNLEDIAEIYDYYFEDMMIERKGDQLLFNLPKPIVQYIDDMPLEELLSLYMQIENEKMYDDDTRMKELQNLKEFIESKYNIHFAYQNHVLNVVNSSDEVFKSLRKLGTIPDSIVKFEREINKYLDNKNYDEAIRLINQVEQTDENLVKVSIFYSGKIQQAKSNYKEAIIFFDYCINNTIKLNDSLSERANCYARIGKYKEQLDDLEALQEIIGYNTAIFANKGIAYINLNKLNEATLYFDKALEMDENNSFALYNRSVAYYRLGEYRKAKQDILRALEIDSNNEFYIDSYHKFYKNLPE